MRTWLWLSRLMLMLHLLTWIIFSLSSDPYPTHILMSVSAVATATSSMADPLQGVLDVEYATLVAWSKILLYTGKQCTATYFPRSLATISASITGMRELASCFSWNLQSLLQKCSKLPRNYAMAHTKLSTKTLCARYSDL